MYEDDVVDAMELDVMDEDDVCKDSWEDLIITGAVVGSNRRVS